MDTDSSNNTTKETKANDKTIPVEFINIMTDFCKDIHTTFPEFHSITELLLFKIVNSSYSTISDIEKKQDYDDDVYELYTYCQNIYPERFFDILYKNEDMFDGKTNTNFLPGINFTYIWGQNISDNTREILWKYLQLILFSITENLEGAEKFGETAKLFEAMDEESLKEKMEETMNHMSDFFNKDANIEEFMKTMNITGDDSMFDDISKMMKADLSNIDLSGMNMGDMPNIDSVHENISSLLGGKLGKLAQEIAEETASEIEIDLTSTENPKEVFEKMFKNPTKLMGLIKNVGTKIEEKVKSGEVNETELMKEASEMMDKMKDMPGMKNMESMLGKMGLPVGKNAKVNLGAFQSAMKNNIKKSTQKDRMKKKLEENKKQRELEEQVKKILKMSELRKKKKNAKNGNNKKFRNKKRGQKNKRNNKKKKK